MLGVADDFDRAIEAMPGRLAGDRLGEGIAAIDRKLRVLLEAEGVTPIEAVGKPFDPRQHEARHPRWRPPTSPTAPSSRELQRGYRSATASCARRSSPSHRPSKTAEPDTTTDRSTTRSTDQPGTSRTGGND